ncbi:MAG: TIGR04076 family protein [Moorellales bacterium]
MAKVVAEVLEVRGCGKCSAGHRPGERLEFTADRTPAMCPWALGALLAPVAVLLHGGSFPWAAEGQPTEWCCPDPTDTVVFRLSRVDE